MKVDKNRVKSVIDAVEDLSARDNRFTFDHFCREHNLYSEKDRERVNGKFIVCPFHSDKNPSLSIDEAGRRFKCFACGAGTSYMQFLVLYDTKVLGIESSISQKANELLSKYPEIRARVGFTSVYQKELKPLDSFSKLEFTKFKKQRVPLEYPEIATYLKKNNFSLDKQMFAVALMQKDVSPDTIMKNLSGLIDTITEKQYSIADLEEE